MSYLNPVAHEISSRRRQICRRVLHGYFHPMATLSYIGHLFKLKVDVVPQDDMIFSHRIASECMMVITSDQCVSVVSLFINSSASVLRGTIAHYHDNISVANQKQHSAFLRNKYENDRRNLFVLQIWIL